MLDFAQARRTMVDCQLRTFDVSDRAVLAAMDEVPREAFMPEGREALAYSDQNIVVWDRAGLRRRAVPPMALGRVIQALELAPDARVLDVGMGLGYGPALMARLGAFVVGLETDEALAAEARSRLGAAGFAQVEIRVGPLRDGCPDRSPFDAILINGAIEGRPTELLDQLAGGGRLVCFERNGDAGQAVLHVKSGDAVGRRALFDVSVPVLPDFVRPPEFQF